MCARYGRDLRVKVRNEEGDSSHELIPHYLPVSAAPDTMIFMDLFSGDLL